jgi:hypothetical protein
MAKTSEPYTIIRRTDSKSFRLTLNFTCGLPDTVCRKWYRRSFQHLPEELFHYRNPKDKSEAKAAAVALIVYLKKKQSEGEARCISIVDVATREFAKDMFTDSAAHIKRWKEKGYILKPQTIDQHRRNWLFRIPLRGRKP